MLLIVKRKYNNSLTTKITVNYEYPEVFKRFD